jgi:FkbM family methyltransferase
LRSRLRLRRLKRLAEKTPRFSPGRIRIDRLDLAYTDLLSLYMEYKDIFVRRIYHFQPPAGSPRIIDGGGCIGMSALYFKRVCSDARIICFEPDETALSVLRRNLAANGAGDVEVLPAGLAAEDGTAAFVPDGSDGGRIAAEGDSPVIIRTTRLSPYLDAEVDFLKLNIEGQELPVLQEVEAAGRLRQVRELVLEYHGWAGAPQRLGEILHLLDRNGFRYLVHDFDNQTCPASKPPFRITPRKTWFCLVYGLRV